MEYKSQWSHEYTTNSPSAKLRLQQIESLLKALKLSKQDQIKRYQNYPFSKEKINQRITELNNLSTLEYFERSQFLFDQRPESNQELVEKVINFTKANFPNESFSKERIFFSIPWLFNALLRFRKEIHQVSCPWKGFDEGFNICGSLTNPVIFPQTGIEPV